jgi:IMP dehydrogenase
MLHAIQLQLQHDNITQVIGEGLTYDDILLVPNYSNNAAPREVSIKTKFFKNITA